VDSCDRVRAAQICVLNGFEFPFHSVEEDLTRRACTSRADGQVRTSFGTISARSIYATVSDTLHSIIACFADT